MSQSFAETSRQRERRSTDMDRPPVDPLIRGVPQGWEDDLTVSSINTAAQPPLASSPPARTLVPTHLRPSPFRDTRQKLSSFSAVRDRIKGKEWEGDRRRHPAIVESSHPSLPGPPTKVLDVDIASVTDASPQLHFSPRKSLDETELGSAQSRTSLSDKNTFNGIPNLFTSTSSVFNTYTPSITSTQSSSSRDGVMGIRSQTLGTGLGRGKTFVTPKTADILPFVTGRPFAAWETTRDSQQTGNVQSSLRVRRPSAANSTAACKGAWRDMPRQREASSHKRIWVDGKGSPALTAYKVGWESEVLEV